MNAAAGEFLNIFNKNDRLLGLHLYIWMPTELFFLLDSWKTNNIHPNKKGKGMKHSNSTYM